MKIINWDTNFNSKLSCHRFAHVDFAPEKMPSLQELQKAQFQINTADRSHPPVLVTIDAIIPFRLAELSNIHTWPSHGMNSGDFIEWMHLKKPVHKDTSIAVYYYKKVNQ